MTAVRRVVVVGRDATLWIAALSLLRALGRTGVTVEVVELPSQLTAADAHMALPSLGTVHDLLDLPQAALLRATKGVPVLGQRFAGWSATQPDFVLGYDVKRPSIDDIDFVQFWARARHRGMRVPLEDFSLAAAAAKQGRTVAADGGVDGLAPGYNLDAIGYATLLRTGGRRGGLTVWTTATVAVEVQGDRIAAVVLDDGTRVQADLFVDASGVDAALIGRLPDSGVNLWTDTFASDTRVAATLPAMQPIPAFTEVVAVENGWLALVPLQDRTGVVGSLENADDSLARLSERIGRTDDWIMRRRTCGVRKRSWIGNCVAIGEAAAVLEPLDAIEWQVVQIALNSLTALWPCDGRDMVREARAHDRTVQAHLANIRDFQLVHYRLNGRNESFWQRARSAPMPDSLIARLSLFAARGLIPSLEDETFAVQDWVAAFAGHGVVPRDQDRAVARMPEGEQMDRFRTLLSAIAQKVRSMPDMATRLATGRAAGGSGE